MVLNKVQAEAVAYIDGPELVFAGAGTGKTRVLTAKIAYLIDQGYNPSRIFAATFTNKAAAEMRERVGKFINAPLSGLWIGTFHSLCARILRREAQSLGYPSAFTIYDTDDQLSVIKKLLREFDIDDRTMPPKYLLSIISSRKSSCVTPEQFEQSANGFRDREIAKLYRAYQKALKDQQAMDFDDLISNTVYLLRGNAELLEKYQDKFRYVLVDEYQDTNKAQFLLVHLLSKSHNKIFAVGDDDQSIYGWRGALIENILSFEKEFPQTKVFKLEENYRSTTAILSFANAAIVANKMRSPKELWTGRAQGVPVKINRFRDDRQEAEYVAGECEKLLQKMQGTAIAILFRTNAQSRVFEESFRKKRIPYVLVGGMSFYERAEIKDCMAYLRLLANVKDDVSFERIMNVPARGLGDKARESLVSIAKEKSVSMLQAVLAGYGENLGGRSVKGFADLRETFEMLLDSMERKISPADILNDVLQASGYMDMLSERAEDSEEAASRMENVNELMNALSAWQEENSGKSLSDFLEEISLASDIDGWSRKDNAVNFMTLHSAKGLEFKSVFLVGVEDGILPSRQNIDDEEKVEEERRLFYVGCTRAMDALECSYADQRFRFGNIQPSEPSRFIDEIPKERYTFSNGTVFFSSDRTDAGIFGSGKTSAGGSGAFSRSSSFRNKSAFGAASGRKREIVFDDDQPVRKREPVYDEFSQEQAVQYRMGQHVTHKIYGKGKIVNISGLGDDTKLTVLFNDGVRRKLMAKFAKLET
jgi:DNA helicase-2/ATP-dependent DNA helicase PcrA